MTPVAHARTTDPVSSLEAAASITPERLSRTHGLILWILAHHPDGLTDEQIEAEWHGRGFGPCTPQNLRSRRAELSNDKERRGLYEVPPVVSVGKGTTRNGGACNVWGLR